jgi:carboxyl-terminal processing protease
MIRLLMAILLLLPLGSFTIAADEKADTVLTPEQTKLNLESFDYVWTTIRDRHFDTTLGGVDWQAAYDELRPEVESAKTMKEARRPFYDLISRLGLSHFGIIPGDLYDNIDRPTQKGDEGGVPGFRTTVVDSMALVTQVLDSTAAATAGVERGWEIIKIGDDSVAALFPGLYEQFKDSPRLEYYLRSAVTSRLRGPIGDSVIVTFLDGRNNEVEKVLTLAEPQGKKVIFGNLPPFYLIVNANTLQDNIGYFYFSCFFDPVALMTKFNQAMQSFMNAPGIIIDIRGNGGGVGAIAVGMVGWLVQQKNLYLGTLTTRETELKLIVNPRARTYTGPVAVLIDGGSASSAEFLAGGLQDMGRARIFGSRSVGAALPSMVERLPNGDGFQYAFGNYVSASGRSLEGNGIIPDDVVQPTREALLEGRDPVLEAAIKWIESQNEQVQ